MTIEVEKFNNVYGIKEMAKFSAPDINNIIYASNGIMKSSFAKAISDIITGAKPKDRIFTERKTEYKLKLLGKEFSDDATGLADNVVVYSRENYDDKLFSVANYSTLVLSTALSSEYLEGENGHKAVEEKIKRTESLIVQTLIEGKPTATEQKYVTEELLKTFGVSGWKELILKIDDTLVKNETLDKLQFGLIFNDKTATILGDEQFVLKCKNYLKTYKNKLLEATFTDKFGLVELEDIRKVVVNSGFLEAGHKLVFSNGKEVTDKESFDDFIKDIESKIEDDPEIKEQYKEISKKLSATEKSKALSLLIKSDPTILNLLVELDKFKKELINTKLSRIETEILNTKQLIRDNEILAKELLEKAEKETTQWENIVKLFQKRFDVPFRIKIRDKKNSVLGAKAPEFQVIYKECDCPDELCTCDGTEEITEGDLNDVLSTGEKRALSVLHLLFDIESSKNRNGEMLVVLDDIVDSFDYKNKYALIEYLGDLISDSLVHCIILTHNFDFYRNCRTRLHGITPWIALSRKRKVQIDQFSGEISRIGLNLFHNWIEAVNTSSSGSLEKALGLLPIARNIIDLKYEASNPGFLKLTKILHFYEGETEKYTFSDYKDILHDVLNLEVPNILDVNIYEEVNNFADNTRSIDEGKLEQKIIFSMAIRYKAEKYMINAIKMNQPGFDFSKIKDNRTSALFSAAKAYLKDDEERILNRVLITTPDFIHINSFMYEPLIDISGSELLNLNSELSSLSLAH